jgi:ribonucleoside-diphosphate reductase alpha chain
MYGSEIKEVERENGVTHLSYHGKEFVGFFRKLGVMPVCAEKKVVPESIFTATEEAVIGFLQGLFTADGTANFVKGKSSYVRLTSKSEKLLKQVQILLLNFGIKSRIYDRSRPARKIFPYRKKDGTEKLYDSDGVCYELEISRDSLPKFTDRIGFMCGKHAGKMAKLAGKGYYRNVFEDAIAEIMPNGKEVVYDLTEPFTHSFICNGIIVSNCGEQPLLPYESCNLGSINLAKMIKEAGKGFEVDWERLKTTTELAVHFLDNVIDANRFPIQQIEFMTMANRKIGLGVMGFADMLIEMGISYASDEALKLGEKIMKFITETAREYSVELGKTRGSFPNFKGSLWEKKGYKTMRNAALTTIAPTGTISIIAGVSSGIEPLFAVVFVRKNVLGGETELLEANPMFEKYAHDHEFYSEALMKEVSDTGSIHHAEGVPKEAKELFLTAHDIDPDSHIKMQAAFQKYTDNAVSKTINLRMEAGISDVEKAYLTAWKLKCKGITIYRDASKTIQVIHIGKGRKEEKEQMIIHNGEGETLKESDESCPACKSKLYSAEGCFTCLGCGYSKCG